MVNAIGYLKASNTGAGDYFGGSVALSADGNTLAVGASFESSAATGINNSVLGQSDNSANNSGAVYVFTHSGTTWSQQAYVKASNTGTYDGFGTSVALSANGHTLAVGAGGEAGANIGVTFGAPDRATTGNGTSYSGAVYIFSLINIYGTWIQQTYVKASNTGVRDAFGASVALSSDGSTLAVGALG